MADKSKPTYLLSHVRELNITLTNKARNTAHSIGFTDTEVRDVVVCLTSKDFDKSTTENYHHQVWQDVYKITIEDKKLYIKFKINNNEVLITSFKENIDILEQG